MPKSRQKRVVTLPNQSSLTMQSRLIVPQPPVGLYIIWVRVRFFIRSMFTEAQASNAQNVIAAGFGKKKRSISTPDDIGNILKRTIEDDQIDVLKKIEQGLEKGGLNGKHCVLRSVCELSETPIHHWTVVGEMITNLIKPKNGTKELLEEYRKAVKIGEEQGDCWSFYPDCPVSIFNIIPDVYTTEDTIEVTFDGFDSGNEYASNDTKFDEDNIEDDIFNMIKDGMKVKEHNIDIDFTT